MENKLRTNWEILKKDGGDIIAIKRSDNLIIGIGDVIKHYDLSIARIISFKKSSWDGAITYNYDTITQCNEPYPKVLREREIGKHFSCIGNINAMKTMSKETKKVYDEWWMYENIRRKGLPKYKVVANFPNSNYRIGQVVNAYSEDDWEENKYWRKQYDKFPNIFKRIN